MGLKKYQAMRNFNQTPEPKGGPKKSRSTSSFVIQKHAARRLHYDFRLEANGVLVSWAVPKGLPTEHGDKRLAVHVEDHPLNYADFEGIIPEGNYGAGTVMVWDRGAYRIDGNLGDMLKKGKIDFTLEGEKLKGAWTLVRTRGLSGGKDPWLIIKRERSVRALSKKNEDRSVKTDRSMAEIAKERDAVWQSHRKTSGSKLKNFVGDKPLVPSNLKKLPSARPAFVEPMKAKLVAELPKGEDWVYEIKFDGVRALAIRDGSSVKLFSRNRIDRAARYPLIVEALRDLPGKSAVLDGEIVALDKKGRSSFQLLQESLDPAHGVHAPIFYYLFDLLQWNGKDLTRLPLTERKEFLSSLLQGSSDPLRLSAHVSGKAQEILKQVKRLKLEGIVAKRAGSPYEVGRRSGAWEKWKIHAQQEFVIGGYTPPQGSRAYFGAILVGYYEKGKLRFASKVGTGFDRVLLKSLFQRFQSQVSSENPFVDMKRQGAPAKGLSAAELRNCVWLKPKFVCEIKFQEWTRDGGLRQPVFLGIREDKDPREVKRERPQ